MKKTYVETYESFPQLIETIVERQNLKGFGDSLAIKNMQDSKAWSGGITWEQASKYLMNGWSEGLEKFKASNDLNNNYCKTQQRRRTITNVQGFMVNVPNAIMNLPHTMFDTIITPIKTKVIDILIDVGYASCVSEEQVRNFYGPLIKKIEQLELSGYRCRISTINVFQLTNEVKQNPVLKLLLKKESEPLDLNKIMFPLMHLAMFRKIAFSWVGKLPNDYDYTNFDYGLGKSMSDTKRIDRTLYDSVLNELHDNNEQQIYIDMSCDIERVFNNMIK